DFCPRERGQQPVPGLGGQRGHRRVQRAAVFHAAGHRELLAFALGTTPPWRRWGWGCPACAAPPLTARHQDPPVGPTQSHLRHGSFFAIDGSPASDFVTDGGNLKTAFAEMCERMLRRLLPARPGRARRSAVSVRLPWEHLAREKNRLIFLRVPF